MLALTVALLVVGVEDPPEGPNVLVMPWSIALGASYGPVLDELLTQAVAERLPEHRVVGLRDVEALLNLELAKDLIGCDDVACAAEIGAALQAEVLIRASMGTVGSRVIAVMKRIDTASGTVVGRVERSMPRDGDIETLIARLADDLLRPERRRFTLRLPGRTHAQWTERVQMLAHGSLKCFTDDECLKLYTRNARAIGFLLTHRDEPATVRAHRPALEARLAYLQGEERRLRESLQAKREPEVKVVEAPATAQPVQVVVVSVPTPPAQSTRTNPPSKKPKLERKKKRAAAAGAAVPNWSRRPAPRKVSHKPATEDKTEAR